jgi:hypothetical protein
MFEGFFKQIKKIIIPVQIQRLILKIQSHKNIIFPYLNDPNVFTTIYKNNFWGSNESYSGLGSNISTTKIIREKLPLLWMQYGIKTFLDIPCGDYNWMKEVYKNNVIYIGGDIVNELIDENNKKYGGGGEVSFKVLDITKDILPTVDMIFCKDCLQHLSYENVFKAMKNFKKSNSKYLLVTSYPLTISNWDIFDGDSRPLNLRKKPFNLPTPLQKIHETSVSVDKWMYLYKLDDIKV